jgi:N-acyl-D-aspartate/D-glutamate deacylase
MFDLLVRNALVFDGLGAPPKRLDVAVKGAVIGALKRDIEEPAKRSIDARGYWLTPGFLDIHTHYDLEVEITPGLAESVRHGVTSVVMGNCSLSLTFGEAAVLGDIFQRVETLPRALVQRWLSSGLRYDGPEQYFESLKALALGPNIAPLLGHSALRAHVMGLRRSLHNKASEQELKDMLKLAERALNAGCIGISIDMVHWHKVSGSFAGRSLPSHHADYREYKALAELCRERDAVFQVTPDPRDPMSFIDLLRLSPGLFRAPLRHTILAALDMSLNRHFWRFFPAVLSLFNGLFGCNIRFQTLAEPFTIYCDGPLTPFFEEFDCGVVLNSCQDAQQRARYWRDKSFRRAFREEWTRGRPRAFHRDLSKITIVDAPERSLIAKTVEQVAGELDQEAVEVFMNLLEKYDTDLRWVATGANDRDAVRQRLMSHRHIFPGFSDAGAHCRNLAFFDSALSVLRQSVQGHFLSPERAIQRVTSEPARWFKISTGELKVGARADFLLLDPEKLKRPIPKPVMVRDAGLGGVERMVKRDSDPAVHGVFIAGQRVIKDGEPLSALGTLGLGRVLGPERLVSNQREALDRYRNQLRGDLADHPFTDYWDVFLLKHQKRPNVILHCIAVVLMYLVPSLALLLGSFWLLLIWPITQGTGLLGHYLYEPNFIDSRDSVFTWRAFSSLNRMFLLVLTGRYHGELLRVQSELASYRSRSQSLKLKEAAGHEAS